MTSEDKVIKINQWQQSTMHSLICGNDSNHPNLSPYVNNNSVTLICTKCNYRQSYIPEVVLNMNWNKKNK